MSIAGVINGQASVTAILRGSGLAPVPIHWTAASDAVDGYNIYRGTTSGAENFKVNVALITGTSFVDYNAPRGLNYYIVKSSIQGVESQVSNEVAIGLEAAPIVGHSTVGGIIHATGPGPLVATITRQALVNGTAKAGGKLAGAVSGHASVTGVPIEGELLASVSGHAVVGGTLKGAGTLADAISRTATVGGTAKAAGKLAGAATGHATVGGTLGGKTHFVSAIAGHASVSGTAKAAGTLAGAITGHASVQLLLKLQSIIFRKATVGGTLTGTGNLVDSISGHASVLGNNSSTGILNSSITGQGSVSGTVVGTGNVLTFITLQAQVGMVTPPGQVSGSMAGQTSVSGNLKVAAFLRSTITGHASVSLKNNPFIPTLVQLGQSVGRGFACSASNPALVLTYQNSLQTFSSGLPVPPIGTPDGWGNLGQRVMMDQLLLAPGNGRLPGRSLAAVASGDVTIPFGSSSVSVNFILNQNYFTITDQTITTYSVPMSTLSMPAPLFPGTYPWSITCRLSDNGSNNGFAQGNFTITINGVTTNGVASSNFNRFVQPQFQLSMGVQFTGTPGPNPFQARMIQFELQRA